MEAHTLPVPTQDVSVREASRTGAPSSREMVVLSPAGPMAEARPAELHVQTCSESALLAADHTPLPPALPCARAPQPGGMEAPEQV